MFHTIYESLGENKRRLVILLAARSCSVEFQRMWYGQLNVMWLTLTHYARQQVMLSRSVTAKTTSWTYLNLPASLKFSTVQTVLDVTPPISTFHTLFTEILLHNIEPILWRFKSA